MTANLIVSIAAVIVLGVTPAISETNTNPSGTLSTTKAAQISPAKHRLMRHSARRDFGANEIRALNILEAEGYRSFGDIRSVGPDIAVNAQKAGKTEHLIVTPSGAVRPAA